MDHTILDQRLKVLPTSVWQKIAQIDELKGQWIGGVKLGPQVLGRLKKSVWVTSTGASTRIEGSKLSDEDVDKLLSPRQLEVWQYMREAIEVTPRELSEKLGIPRPTINQVLDKLRDLKMIERLGLGRGTRYRIIE